MAMSRTEKEQAVTELKSVFDSASAVVIMHYRGLTVSEISNLRTIAREQGTMVKVTKNSLTKRAANDTKFAELAKLFSGPTAIAHSNDEVSAAKVVVKFAKDNEKLEIIGGAVNGETLDASGVLSLASMPTLDESRSMLIGLIGTPARNIATLTQAPAKQLARVIGAYASSGE